MSTAVALLDLVPRLALFAEGVAGTPFHILPLDPDHNRPATTQRTLHLPLEPPDGSAADAPVRSGTAATGAYRALIVQQLAPLLFATEDYSGTSEHPLPDEPDSGEIQGALHRFFQTFDAPTQARALFYRVEAVRLDACIRREFPGIVLHLQRINNHRLAMLELPSGPMNSCHHLLTWLECQPDARDIELLSIDTPPAALAVLEEVPTLREATATVNDSADLTLRLWRCLRPEHADYDADDSLLDELAAEQDQPGVAELVQQEEAVASLELDLMSLAEEIEIEPGDTPGSQSMLRTLEGERDNLKRRIDMQRARMARAAPSTDLSETRSYLYDEWNYLEQAYVRGWCRLFEHTLTPGDAGELAELARRIGDLARQVRRQFEHIRPLALTRVRPLEEGDEIYLDALIDHEIDRRTGRVTEARVYSMNTRQKREIATAFLVDLSASTDEALPDPDAEEPDWSNVDEDDPYAFENEPLVPPPVKRRIIDVQREALWLMSQALGALGDDFGIYGFSGYGHDEVEIFLVKELGQALTPRVLQTLMNMQPKRSTRMGPAIRHMIAKLKRQEVGRRILLLISDGFPQDSDYGPDRGNHEYGVQDTAKALLEAQAAGIETFCITVDTSGHDYLHRMCPEQRYMVIEEIEELPLALTKVYRKLAF